MKHTSTFLWAALGAALLVCAASGCGKGSAPSTGIAPPPAAPPPAASANHAADEQAADKAAQAWLALIDGGKFTQSWKTAAPAFQKATSQDFWATTAQAVRAPLGKLQSRKRLSAQYAAGLPGAPDGECVVLQYRSAFAQKKDAVETVTPMRDKGGPWKVSGYYIK